MAKVTKQKTTPSGIKVSIRMYCIGTGDCFVLKFDRGEGRPFTLMIDCGSCRGSKEDFTAYVQHLKKYVENTVDLLIITHEHNDHVNGFDKCEQLFSAADFTIREAWFAWTEKPTGPESEAAELLKKRASMKLALSKAIAKVKDRNEQIRPTLAAHPLRAELLAAQESFEQGLDTLGTINLTEEETGSAKPGNQFAITGNPLPGMKKIKEILAQKKTRIRYPNPGETVTVDGLEGIRFFVLGPPRSKDFIYKDGKEGTDVYKKNNRLNESTLAASAFQFLGDTTQLHGENLPFANAYVVEASFQEQVKNLPADSKESFASAAEEMMAKYYWVGKYRNETNPATGKLKYEDESWRTINDEWLMSAGTLALRLNSHINNTSLALAIEAVDNGKVMLLPGDAEYGSWESWHLIENWKQKGKNGKHLVEDLLGRTVFYKVGHHLSYNGTALEKGINLMPGENMAAMATLDLERIAKGWKSTMPNESLLQDIIQRTGGRFFIMNEEGITNKPSTVLDPLSLGKDTYEEEKLPGTDTYLYKQYTFSLV